MEAGQPDACFLIGDNITISTEMHFTGSRPLVLFAAGSITIDMPIDVASHLIQGGQPIAGAGALRSNGGPPIECQTPTPPGTNLGGAGGGAGGSFIGKGGDGGGGTSLMGTRGLAAQADASRPDKLRAGCPGGIGGTGNGGGGGRGAGGGAIYFVAGEKISINTSINASGAAASGGGATAGGGGGGSGGMIVMHAPAITGTSGVLFANGGGGGGAGGASLGGFPGSEASPTAASSPAVGGSGSNGGGTGGDGAAGARIATSGTSGVIGGSGAGGGGGGGGAGYILMSSVPSQVAASPPIVIFPNL
jgi:hypothetical protein